MIRPRKTSLGVGMYAIRMLVRIAAIALLASPAVQSQELTITNARIIVGNGEVIEGGSLVVRGGKIAAVAAGRPAQSAGRVIDARGGSLMPGFIDAHRHITLCPTRKPRCAGCSASCARIRPARPRADAARRYRATSTDERA